MSPPADPVRVEARLWGHVGGFGQFSRLMQLSLERPRLFDLEAATEYLSSAFDIDMTAEPAPDALQSTGLEPPARGLLAVTFALARSLLQAGGVPVFERPRVLRVLRPKTPRGPQTVEIRIPALPHVHSRWFAASWREAVLIAEEFTRPAYQRKDMTRRADALAEGLIDPMKTAVRGGVTTVMFLRAAQDRGIPALHLSRSTFQLGTGCKAILFSKGALEQDSAIGAKATEDKSYCAQLLQGLSAPVPQSRRARSADEAVAAAEALGYPVVVKPADRDRSEGVSVDLRDAAGVRAAWDAAAALSDHVLVQTRIPGHCHRLVTFGGRFVFGFTRHPKSVVGDGTATVAELAERHNALQAGRARHLRQKLCPMDDLALDCLAAAGHGADTVLAEGEVAHLRPIQDKENGGHNEIVTDRVHPENIRLVERVSRFFRLQSAGFDLIAPDPARPWFETGGAITELNWQPQIGDNTANAYLDALFPDGTSTIPVECFVGASGAMEAGLDRLERLRQEGRSAALTSHARTIGPDGADIVMAGTPGLLNRAMTMLRDRQIDSLIVVAETDELVHTGRPVQAFDAVTVTDETLRFFRDPERPSKLRGADKLRAAFPMA